jgi:hypothetical protein
MWSDERSEMLTAALTCCLIVDVLMTFIDEGKTHSRSEKAIQAIADARRSLLFITGQTSTRRFWDRRQENFDRLSQQKLLKEVVDSMNWRTWRDDLEQWLLNAEKVLEFFGNVQDVANGRCSHHGCF